MPEQPPSRHQPSRLSVESGCGSSGDTTHQDQTAIQHEERSNDAQAAGQESYGARPFTGASLSESIVTNSDLPDHELAFLDKVSAKKNADIPAPTPIQMSFITRPLTAEGAISAPQPCLAFARRHTILPHRDAQDTNASGRPSQNEQESELAQTIEQSNSPTIAIAVEQEALMNGTEQQQHMENGQVTENNTIDHVRPSSAGISSERQGPHIPQQNPSGSHMEIDRPFGFLENIAHASAVASVEPTVDQGPTHIARTKRRHKPKRKRRVPHHGPWPPRGQNRPSEVHEEVGRAPAIDDSPMQPADSRTADGQEFDNAAEHIQLPNHEPSHPTGTEQVAAHEIVQPVERDSEEQIQVAEAIVPTQEQAQAVLQEFGHENNPVGPVNINDSEIERHDPQPEVIVNLTPIDIHPENHNLLGPAEVTNEPQGHTSMSGHDLAYDNSPVEPSCHSVNMPVVQHEHVDDLLHDRSGPAHTHRISKPRRKVRAIALPTSTFDSSSTSNFASTDRLMEAWQRSYVAEKLSVQREFATQAKHHEESSFALHQVIDMQKESITEWKDKYNNLDRLVDRLKVGAKMNQKYVTSLHKDFEAFRKSSESLQQQDKAILQAKLAEVEEEKLSLHRDIESTLNVLDKSQKNLKSTVNELYMKLALSETKSVTLHSDLAALKIQHDDEKKKCQKLETQILASTQSIQKQLSNESDALSKKLADIQHSLDNPAGDENRKRDMNECLTTLRQVQQTPFLTTKDCHKAEEKLRYVHERFNNGFRLFRDLIDGMQGPARDNHQTLLSELHTVRGEVLKYEKIAEENIKSHESNRVLQEQLKSQLSRYQLLEERILAHQNNEDELRARNDRLESGNKELTEAHQADLLKWDAERNQSFVRLQSYEQDLVDIANHATSLQAQCLSYEEERQDLLAQLESDEHDVEVGKVKLKDTQGHLHAAQNEATTYKGKLERCKAELIAVVERYNEQHSEILGLRKEFEGKLAQALAEQAISHQNDLHRVKVERDAAKEEASKHQRELSAAKEKIQNYTKRTMEVENQLIQKRNEDNRTEELLRKANITITAEREKMVQELEDLKSQILELQAEKANLGATISQKHTAMETLRQAQDSEIAKAIEVERRRCSELEAINAKLKMALAEMQESHELVLLPSGPVASSSLTIIPENLQAAPARKRVHRQNMPSVSGSRAMSYSDSHVQSLDIMRPEHATSQGSVMSWSPLDQGFHADAPAKEHPQTFTHNQISSHFVGLPPRRTEPPQRSDEATELSSPPSSTTLDRRGAELQQSLVDPKPSGSKKQPVKKGIKPSRSKPQAVRTFRSPTRRSSRQQNTEQPKLQANTSRTLHGPTVPLTPLNRRATSNKTAGEDSPDFLHTSLPRFKHTYADHHARTSKSGTLETYESGRVNDSGEKRKGHDVPGDGNVASKRPRTEFSSMLHDQAGDRVHFRTSPVHPRDQSHSRHGGSVHGTNTSPLSHVREASSSRLMGVKSSATTTASSNSPYHQGKGSGLKTTQNKYTEAFKRARNTH